MPYVRLIGLVLFITSVFIGLAALATQTTHIRFKRPTRGPDGRIESPFNTHNAAGDPSLSPDDSEPLAIQFFSVPVAYPLLAAGVLGLIFWFSLAHGGSPVQVKRRRRRRRRKR